MTKRQKQRMISRVNPFRFFTPVGISSLLFVVSLFIAVPLWATTSTATNGGAMGASTGLGGSTGQGTATSPDSNSQNNSVSAPAAATATHPSTQGGVQFGPGPQFGNNETAAQNNAANNQSQNGSVNPYAGNAQPSCTNGLSSADCGSAAGANK